MVIYKIIPPYVTQASQGSNPDNIHHQYLDIPKVIRLLKASKETKLGHQNLTSPVTN